jgi:hypothetical protein
MPIVATEFRTGAVVAAGIIAGLVFIGFKMVAAAVLVGPQAFFMPLRMIGAIVLGREALDPSYWLFTAAITGAIVHIVLSLVFASIFAWIGFPAASPASYAVSGIVFGLLLWLINFYLIAPAVGWTWFPGRSNAAVQFLAHTFFFGCPVGWYLGKSRLLVVRPRS